ncbi:MAG: WG repeat-containing protein, partial [Acinetobacter sp.]
VLHNDYFGYINKEGKCESGFIYEYGNSFSEGLASVGFKGENVYIDEKFNVKIKGNFDFTTEFSKGMAAVSVNNKW